MKILIPILLALFISSNASANDYSIKDVCKYIEDEVTSNFGMIVMHDERAEREREKMKDINLEDDELFKETNDKRNKYIKISKIFKESMVKESKTYHYLDCSDFRE
jgi:hypothetical protein